ncbi:MAG TPA: FtsW/RodA/SpoVE family cell cycle protein [Thermomicrobiales bacterium]|jgi:rod shape determining protein RodA|nr:FtsW/RodA/SpoVE family cell cycle protein [Thermomicrobiales bacterium]
MAIALGNRSARSRTASSWRDFDFYLIATMFVLMGFGLVAIFSAYGLGSVGESQAVQQGGLALIGLILMIVVASIDYRFLASLAIPIYAAGIAGILAVKVVGDTISGAQSWIYIGPITIQPSEFAKVTTLIALATFVSSRGAAMRDPLNMLVASLIVALPAGLVLIEPDLGSSIIYMVMWFAVMITARTRPIYFVLGFLALPAVIFVAWNYVMEPYQRTRLLVSYDPGSDPQGAGFNIIQARIAIGDGGLWGRGLAGGTQSQYDLLSVRESDFIFAHVSSMFGFVGMLALMIAFVLMLWRVLRVVDLARDQLGQCLAMGIFGMLFFQTFLNIGYNIGLMPVTGVTLPFISQGSSSLWTYLIGIGILQSILLGHRKFAFQRGL